MTTAYLGPGRFKTASGIMLDALDPSFNSPTLEDICVCLSHINRFGGHVVHGKAFSVAAHSIAVGTVVQSHISDATPHRVLAAYIHDFAEVITGDIIGPMKVLWKVMIDPIESVWNRHFERMFSLPHGIIDHPSIKAADKFQFYLEDMVLKGSPLPGSMDLDADQIRFATESITDLLQLPPDGAAELLMTLVKEAWEKA